MSAPDLEPAAPHGRPPTRAEKWTAYKESPYFPATVLVFILAAAAGLFAGSYTYAMANPTPHRIPVAVVSRPAPEGAKAFVAGMDKALDASLDIHVFATRAKAREALDEQEVFAIMRAGDRGVSLDVAGASGAAVAQLLAESAVKVGAELKEPVVVRDIKPLQRGDPRGLALFYISLAAVIVGFVGAIQLSVHARELIPLERIAFTVGYSLLGGFVIAAVVDWWLGAVDLPFFESWMILAFTMFTSGMVFTMFNTLMGRWAMLPTWGSWCSWGTRRPAVRSPGRSCRPCSGTSDGGCRRVRPSTPSTPRSTTRAISGSSRIWCSGPGRWSPARCSGCGATGTRVAVTTCLSMRPRPPDPGPGYSSLIRMSRYETTSVVLWT